MLVTKSPPCLNIHAKSLLLRHLYDSIKKAINTGEFLKFMVISREYLRASQIYNVYMLFLSKLTFTDGFNASFKSVNDYGALTFSNITFDGLCKLNELLKIPNVKVKFQHQTDEIVNEFIQLFENYLIQSKLALYFERHEPWKQTIPIAPIFIRKFSERICEIKCDASALIDNTLPMKLDLCNIENAESFDQIKSILKTHQIKVLYLHTGFSFDKTIAPNYFDDFPTCSKLNHIDFNGFSWDIKNSNNNGSFESLTKMHNFFPNLKEFIINVKSYEGIETETTSRQTMDAVLSLHGRIVEFQAKYNSSTFMWFNSYFSSERYESQQEINTSIEYLKSHEPFDQLEVVELNDHEGNSYQISHQWETPNFRVYIEIRFKFYTE